MSTPTEAVIAAVADVEAAAATAIESAENRALAAEAVAASVTDAAIRTELSDRITDIAEDVLQCREENQSLRTELATFRQSMENQMAELTLKVQAPPTMIVAPAVSAEPQSILPASTRTEATLVTTVEPSSESAAVPLVPATPQRRSRLI